MSKVFNMVGGGGGKNISSIIITGLESTDTVTCIKDGKSYTTTWDDTAQHWEIVGLPFGTFTVTATNGTKTSTETVLIDIAGVYEIEMNYLLWLYKDGDEFEDVTGGWGITKLSGRYATFNSIQNPIDLTTYKTLYVKYSIGSYASTESGLCALSVKSQKNTLDYDLRDFIRIPAPSNGIASYDISAITGEKYIDFYNDDVSIAWTHQWTKNETNMYLYRHFNGSYYAHGYIERVWLE